MTVPKKITSLYAWIATEADGGEGLPAMHTVIDGQEYFMPLMGADMARIKSLRGKAELVARRGNVRLRLCRFQLVDELDEL